MRRVCEDQSVPGLCEISHVCPESKEGSLGHSCMSHELTLHLGMLGASGWLQGSGCRPAGLCLDPGPLRPCPCPRCVRRRGRSPS